MSRKTFMNIATRIGGFTFIELAVSLTVLAIVIAIGAPSMSNFISEARLSSQSDLLVDSLNLARMEAVKQRTDVTFCPAEDPDTATNCSTNAGDWSKGWITNVGTTIAHRVQVNRNVTIGNSQSTAVFSGTLGSAFQARSFTLCLSGQTQQQVDVALSGHISKRINTGTTCP